jgi:hypothetical protein
MLEKELLRLIDFTLIVALMLTESFGYPSVVPAKRITLDGWKVERSGETFSRNLSMRMRHGRS